MEGSAVGRRRTRVETITAAAGAVEGGAGYAKLKPRRGSPREVVVRHQRSRIRRAMIELVAEQGYEAVKVSELAARAGVSTRDFYLRCQGKQECLLDTHDWIMEQATRRLIAAVGPGRGVEERTRLALEALGEMLARHPVEARFACLDAAAAGLGILERRRRSAEALAVVVAGCLEGSSRRSGPSPLLAGIVMGLSQVVCSLLIEGRESEFALLAGDLQGWIGALAAPEAGRLAGLARRRPQGVAAPVAAFRRQEGVDLSEEPRERERRQILEATLRLAAGAGYWQLTVPRIRAEVGISRARFDAHFDDVEDCFAAAVGLVGTRVMDFAAETAAGDGEKWPRGFHHAVEALCAYTAREPVMARLALVEIFAAGPRGLRDFSHLIEMTAERLRTGVPRAERPSAVVAEASMGAVLTLVHRSIAMRHPECLARLAPYLSYLTLAPVVGPTGAIEAIRGTTGEIWVTPSSSP